MILILKIDNYLKYSNKINSKTRINLSKEYNILIEETAFFAKMLNEVPVTDKMIKITNKNKEAYNKKTEKSIVDNSLKENNEYIYNNELFAYDKEEEKSEEENKKFFFKLFSTKNNSDNSIIKKKKYKLKEKKKKNQKNLLKILYQHITLIILSMLSHLQGKNWII